MAGNLVALGDLMGKDAFAKTATNVRAFVNVKSKVLRVVKAGDKIGNIYSHVEGRDDAGNKDGSIWFMTYDDFGQAKDKPAYFKYGANVLDWKALQEQGVQTVQEKTDAKAEADKGILEKLGEKAESGAKSTLNTVLMWGGIFLLLSNALKGDYKQNAKK